jgi:hypothetical protein
MVAYGTADQVTAAVPTGGTAGFGTWNVPNFVGELFKLSPLDTPLLSLIGGLTGGISDARKIFTWQDTLHRAPALQANPEGADATFVVQKRSERVNVCAIHQYGVELTYAKQAATDRLGTSGATPDITATSILGNQPVQDEMAAQLQIQVEQAALDVEIMFLDGTLANPADGTARQSQGVVGAVDAATTTDYTLITGTPAGRLVVDDLSKKLYDNGAPMRNCIIMTNSLGKVDLGTDYQINTTGGWNVQPRSYNIFGVNVTDIETAFGKYPVVLNRHLDEDTLLILELDILAPHFMPTPGRGHFFIEPLAKSGSYDRAQLYGDIGLEYGPSGWHAKAFALNS